jgi:hypothetical protein
MFVGGNKDDGGGEVDIEIELCPSANHNLIKKVNCGVFGSRDHR